MAMRESYPGFAALTLQELERLGDWSPSNHYDHYYYNPEDTQKEAAKKEQEEQDKKKEQAEKDRLSTMVWPTQFAPWADIPSEYKGRERTASEEEFLLRELYPHIYFTGGFAPTRKQLEMMAANSPPTPDWFYNHPPSQDKDKVDDNAVKRLEQEMEETHNEQAKDGQAETEKQAEAEKEQAEKETDDNEQNDKIGSKRSAESQTMISNKKALKE